jgi:hypothetical protein
VLDAKISLFGVSCKESRFGFNCTLDNSFQISGDGEWVLGKRFNEFKKWEIVRENFETGENVIFDQIHQDFIYTLILHEELGVVMSGANDGLAVLYYWQTGKMKSKIKMNIGLVKSSLLMNTIVVLGGYYTIGCLDLKSGKKAQISQKDKIETECDHVFSIVYTEQRGVSGIEGTLVIGGSNSPIATRVKLIKGFVEKFSKMPIKKNFPTFVPPKNSIPKDPPVILPPNNGFNDPIKFAFDSISIIQINF